MNTLVCFLCAKEITNLDHQPLETQKSLFEEHLSDVHEAIYEVDFLFSASTLNLKQRHDAFKEELGSSPKHFLETKDILVPPSGPKDGECITKKGTIIVDFDKARQCQFCERWFTRPWCLKKHLLKCTVKRQTYDETKVKFECRVCKKTFLLKSYLRDHEESHRDITDKPYTCVYIDCVKVFKDRNAANGCERVHEQLFKCDVCAICLRGKKELERHKLAHNQLRFIYQCEECDVGNFG